MVLKELNMEQIIKVEHNRDVESNGKSWKLFGNSAPRSEIVSFVQIVIIYVVVGFCLFNLTTGRGDLNLWSALLSGSLGYLLRNPTIKHK